MAELLHEVGVIISALGVPIVAWVTYLGLKQGKANSAAIADNTDRTEEVHVLVNGTNGVLTVELKQQAERIEAMIEALASAGIPIPGPETVREPPSA